MYNCKRLTGAFVFLFLLISSAFSQSSNFWEPAGAIPKTDVWSIAVNASGHIYAGTGSGIYKSTDNGDSWISIGSELNNQSINSIFLGSNGLVLVGTSENGIYRSINDGATWTYVSEIYNSTDNGINWNLITKKLDVRSIITSPDGRLYAGAWDIDFSGTGGIFVSTNNGERWNQSNTGLGNLLVRPGLVDSNKVYVGTSGTGVFNSSDGGYSWNRANTYADQNIVCLAAKGKDIYAGTTGMGILKSTDEGLTWMPVNSGLKLPSEKYIRTIIQGTDGKLYAGTFYDGFFRSEDNGNNWYKINSGLKNLNILSASISKTGKIFCGTNGSGVFRSASYATPVINTDIDTIIFEVRQNSVIPANQILNIYNIGAGNLNWTASIKNKSGWLAINPVSGTDYTVINISVITTNLVLGNYIDTILINSPNAGNNPRAVTIIYKVTKTLDVNSKNAPKDYTLAQNYPNPFNPETKIEYTLKSDVFVSIVIYDSYGRELTKLVNQHQTSGLHSISWKPENISSGVYYYKITAGDFSDMKKMVYMR
jgi:photosystem II stability/assembly factor-like uncharacterized protein